MIDYEIEWEKLHKTDWDLILNGNSMDVYFISKEGCSNTDTYCCPSGEKPVKENTDVVLPWAEYPCWGIICEEKVYSKTKYGESIVHGTCVAYITRNGEKFYEDIRAGGFASTLVEAQSILQHLKDHPIPFGHRNWKEHLLNKKVWWCDQPAVVKEIIGDGTVELVPDKEKIEEFRISNEDRYHAATGGMPIEEEDKKYIRTTYLDKRIGWFRE